MDTAAETGDVEIISEDYRKQNEMLHEQRADYGTSGRKYAEMVHQVAAGIRAESILDFGCGKQTLADALPHLEVKGYDPCIPGLDDPPEPADLVVCTDVLEHVEPEYTHNVLDQLMRLTKKVLFVSVATRPAKKTLPDGRNAHINLHDPDWWIDELRKRFRLDSFNRVPGSEFIATLSAKDYHHE